MRGAPAGRSWWLVCLLGVAAQLVMVHGDWQQWWGHRRVASAVLSRTAGWLGVLACAYGVVVATRVVRYEPLLASAARPAWRVRWPGAVPVLAVGVVPFAATWGVVAVALSRVASYGAWQPWWLVAGVLWAAGWGLVGYGGQRVVARWSPWLGAVLPLVAAVAHLVPVYDGDASAVSCLGTVNLPSGAGWDEPLLRSVARACCHAALVGQVAALVLGLRRVRVGALVALLASAMLLAGAAGRPVARPSVTHCEPSGTAVVCWDLDHGLGARAALPVVGDLLERTPPGLRPQRVNLGDTAGADGTWLGLPTVAADVAMVADEPVLRYVWAEQVSVTGCADSWEVSVAVRLRLLDHYGARDADVGQRLTRESFVRLVGPPARRALDALDAMPVDEVFALVQRRAADPAACGQRLEDVAR